MGKTVNLLKRTLNPLFQWNDEHPYLFSFIISVSLIAYFLFRIPYVETAEEEMLLTEDLIIIDIQKIKSPLKQVKKEITIDEGKVATEETNVQRAVGTSEDASAVDLAFYPNIAPPRLIGKLKKRYPKIGEKMNIEAILNTELLIGIDGKVKHVNILGIRLSKELQPDLHNKIEKQFMHEARKSLKGAQFTPAIIEGKKVPIKMERPLHFRLN